MVQQGFQRKNKNFFFFTAGMFLLLNKNSLSLKPENFPRRRFLTRLASIEQKTTRWRRQQQQTTTTKQNEEEIYSGLVSNLDELIAHSSLAGFKK